jgi:glycosyltransferase involved in cell wall biosynthesis
MNKSNEYVLQHDLTEFLKQFMVHYRFVNPQGKNNSCNWNKEVLFITKFPPTIGGVATQEYWRARQLALHGFKVRVVTNCNETDVTLRSKDWTLDDLKWIDFTDQDSGGLLKTYYTEPSFLNKRVNKKHKHIPMDSMSQSKLTGLAYKIIKEYNSSIIISGYLEPYGAAANEISRNTGIPVYQHFAGSDIERLSNIPEIGWRYESLIQEAAMISTSWDKLARLLTFNVTLQNLNPIPPPTLLPPELFCPEGKKMYVKDEDEIVLGIYGKYSRYKCAEELLQAILQILEQGMKIKVLLLLIDDYSKNRKLNGLIERLKTRNAVLSGEGVPPWKIPEFIRSCDAICLLESNFPIKVHAPITPLEVALCGKPIIFSREMFNKIRLDGFEEGMNCVVVDDPRDISQLTLGIKQISYLDEKNIFGLRSACNKNLNFSLWDDYVYAIESLINRNEARGKEQKKFFSDLLSIYCFFPLTMSLLKNYSDETYEWIQHNSFIEDSLTLAYEYQKFLKKRFLRLNLFLDDAISYEAARVESYKLAKGLHLDHIAYHPHRLNFLDREKFDYRVQLRCTPVLATLNTNIVEVYSSLFRKSFSLRKVEATRVLFLASNGLTSQCLPVSNHGTKILEELKVGLSIKDVEEKSYLIKQLEFYNYLVPTISNNLTKETEELSWMQ